MAAYRAFESPEDIRLLHIAPAPYHVEGVHCEISYHCRSTLTLQYDALSYVWGDASKPRPISVGLSKVMVTPNCYDALRRLRHETESRVVWIDAICINQSDNEEKTKQVRRMDNVYAQAHQVKVYLGESDGASEHLFQILQQAWSEKQFDPSFDHVFPMASSATVEATRAILQRPWFSRVWIIQEVFFAAADYGSSATVMCGGRTIRWDMFTNSCLQILKYDWSAYMNPRGLPYIILIGDGDGLGKDDLFGTLCKTRSSHATDPRDKLFGISSLVDWDHYGEKDTSSLMQNVSYNDSVTTIYTATGLRILKKYQLGLLQAIRRPHNSFVSLATWLPDWSRTSDNDPFQLDRRQPKPCHSTDFEQLDCCSPKTTDSDHTSHPILVVNGYYLDRIASLGETFDFNSSRADCLNALARMCNDTDGFENIVYLPQGFDRRKYDNERFCDLLTGDNQYSGSPQYEKALDGFRIFLGEHGMIGLAPTEARDGDIVYALPTAAQPCILRYRSVDTQTLVSGDCYVLGTQAAYEDYQSERTETNDSLRRELSSLLQLRLGDIRQLRIW